MFNTLTKDLVKTVSTKFYYLNKKMYYKIIITYGNEDMHLFKDFDDYSEYQKYHDNLLNNINNNSPIPNEFGIMG